MDKVFELIKSEEQRQTDSLQMIASENYVSKEVLRALGSVLTNKYSEGYVGKRYYQGNKIVDEIESLAVERAKKLFGIPHVNVQPYSGSPANIAAISAVLLPGETLMGLKLSSGGHLTHGHPKVTFSGKYFKSVQFELGEEDNIDYESIEKLALAEKPKLIIVGTTAYPKKLDWEKFAEIAQMVDAYLLADISHVAGLIVGGVHPSPVPFAHIVMTTTHKTLRGPRGAMLMVTRKGLDKDIELAKKIDRAVFPGLQGGPHDNVTAAIAVALGEAETEEFREYALQVVKNAKTLAEELKGRGLKLCWGGTENHLMVVDLRPVNLDGKSVAEALEKTGIVVNANSVPNDTNPPMKPSGIRLGTAAITTRGMKESEMKMIAEWIVGVINKVENEKYLSEIKCEVSALCKKFPV